MPSPAPRAQKGFDYERSMCRRLSFWVTGNTREDVFWRSSMSGGRANLPSRKSRRSDFEHVAGDITAVHPSGALLLQMFVIECKFWKTFDFEPVLFKNKTTLLPFYEKTRDEALSYGRQPLFIAKKNRSGEICITTQAGFEILGHGGVVIEPSCTVPRVDGVVFLLTDLFLIDFQNLRKAADSGKIYFNRGSPSNKQSSGRVQMEDLQVHPGSSGRITRVRL